MLRFAAALFLIAAPALAAGPEDSIVRVIVKEHDKVLASKSGLVIPGGFVVTTCGAFNTITKVEVVVAGHDPVQARGVVAYNFPENLMLMRIDWEGQAPPAATLADAPPPKGEAFTMIGAGRGAEEFKLAEEADVSVLTFGSPRGDPSLGGSTVMYKGRVVGIVTGASMGLAVGDPKPGARSTASGIKAARVELIKALNPGEVILWSKWNKKVEPLRRADQIFKDGLKEADPRKIKDAKYFADEWTTKCKQVVELDPFHGRAWAELTMLHLYAHKQPGEALIASTHAIALGPCDDEVFRARSNIMSGKAEWNDAIDAAKTAIRLRPATAENHAALGAAYIGNRQYDDAVNEYKEAVRLDPKSTDAAEGLKKAEEWRAKGK